MEMPSVERGQPLPLLHDPSDFEAFVRGQREGLVRILRQGALHGDAPDLAQERPGRPERYRGCAPTTCATRLYRIAIHMLGDRLRRTGDQHGARRTALDIDLAETTSPEQSRERQLVGRQELAELQGALLGLPLRCRQIYLLDRIGGMSYTEIANHCGISVKAVEKHISKALRLLGERLAPFNREIPRP